MNLMIIVDSMENKIELVTVYYNDVFISVTHNDEPYEVYADCPYVNIPKERALSFAEEQLDNGDWDAYLIPEFVTHRKIIYHES